MAERLHDPWLVAVWPGMGTVAMGAGYYLMAKLGMHLWEELPARDLFEVDHVDVKDGLIQTAPLPRSRLFLWKDPNEKHDLIVFIGEAQPPAKSAQICHQLIDLVRPLGVTRVFTFAAMATGLRPGEHGRVFGAAIDRGTLDRFRDLDLTVLEGGQINGLNGVLLGVAAESGMQGGCLLGEMPQLFSQLPYPKASLAVLEFFATLAGIKIDLTELESHAQDVEDKLETFLSRIEQAIHQVEGAGESAIPALDADEEDEKKKPKLSAEDRQHLEQLFTEAKADRARAYFLKQELDRLKVFRDFEDRFLDLFKK
ncbi:PAC2 family protein [Luteolibacter flavescens]|uniref:PAC2 family protein n=1 Tax=Luteolibacter flavescens TaxID=1859460 RepID=A0ABT3FQ55_9BACT|nr:PAC2 family protein [Luteolibacter flavescens]MCW1885716.1 PAC2 family protein [Luteolibacter flavescens]